MKRHHAGATVSRHIKQAKQIFTAAVDKELISKNPFAMIKAGGQDNEARKAFIDRETAYKVLAAYPSLEWRLLFALSRFGACAALANTWG
jgi:hypothetical protein